MKERFEIFKSKHNKVYGDLAEEELRFGIYQDTMNFVEQRNSANLGYTLTENFFADLSMDEIRR
jgi:hypothetical protein